MALLGLLFLMPALAGYADVDEDGDPRWADRELHVWTNAARVAPESFESDYEDGGCAFTDFSADEQTPKPPLFYSRDLNEAALFHTEDMLDSGDFSHDSSDGTSFQTRLAGYYPESGYVGENIADGYGSSYQAVFQGWMCSTEGHRANIMSGDYNELGTGVDSAYYTQDFGMGTVDSTGPVTMALHEPEQPSDSVTLYADWTDTSAPAALDMILDGTAIPLSVEWGVDTQGVFSADAAIDDASTCHEYYAHWKRADGSEGTVPETGSYTFGSCDNSVGWTDEQACIFDQTCPEEDGAALRGDVKLTGCATEPGTPPALGVLAALCLCLSRRRASAR